ncbi:hypothetical protein K438DRAFT_1954170 [Mycena galopus ATCC 62051]|nr:hypothetical protein K438DRAFT_1954170 [Mycena galopus ATCC 62051]
MHVPCRTTSERVASGRSKSISSPHTLPLHRGDGAPHRGSHPSFHSLPLLPLPPRARQDDASGRGKTSGPGKSILARARGLPTRSRSTISRMWGSHRGPDTNRGGKVPATIERYLDVLIPAPSCISPSSGGQTDHCPPHAPKIALSIDEFIKLNR